MARATRTPRHAETCLARSGGPIRSENKNCVRVFFVAQVCVALRSVIAVAGKFASILICGLAA